METFKEVIRKHLENRAKQDPLFAEAYKKKNKNIDQCCDYILGEVKKKTKKDAIALTDDEVYCIAVHYYDEDNIKVAKTPAFRVVVTQPFVTEQETEPKTIENKRKNKPKTVSKTEVEHRQLSLFENI